jgi:hypothetical protein
MLRTLRAFLVLSMVLTSVAATAEEVAEEATGTPSDPTADETTAAAAAHTAAATPVPAAAIVAPALAPVEAKPGLLDGWRTEAHGYFRAPMSLGISWRPNPDEMGRLDPNDPEGKRQLPDGPSQMQVSYGPNRIMDWSYYSFAYTRLQEQDWAELFIHQKKKHVDAAIGWMGYWLSAAGYRRPDAAWTPGMAYLTLDTDFQVGGYRPNVALTMGSWWPSFGYVEKYDTYTLGRFRQLGEQLTLTIPLSPELTVTFTEGFGTNRDGSYSYLVNNQLYAGKTGINLIGWLNLQLSYRGHVDFDVGLHANYMWTRDPFLTAEASAAEGKAYSKAASKAYMAVVGGEAKVSAPVFGRLWVSPSFISIKEGWTLGGSGGTEVMHAQGGMGIATNFMAWTGAHDQSTGSGSMLNLGILYENSLSNLVRTSPGVGDVTLNIFALMALASMDLPAGKTDLITQDKIKQFKYGADLTVLAQEWLSFMLRGDMVNYDLDHPGYVFAALTGRTSLFSHFLSSECIYLQFSYYIYGDNMKLVQRWPWGVPLTEGSDTVQGYASKYVGKKPDEYIVKLQAQVKF